MTKPSSPTFMENNEIFHEPMHVSFAAQSPQISRTNSNPVANSSVLVDKIEYYGKGMIRGLEETVKTLHKVVLTNEQLIREMQLLRDQQQAMTRPRPQMPYMPTNYNASGGTAWNFNNT